MELGNPDGAGLLVRVQRPSEMPLESLHGRKDDVSRTLAAEYVNCLRLACRLLRTQISEDEDGQDLGQRALLR